MKRSYVYIVVSNCELTVSQGSSNASIHADMFSGHRPDYREKRHKDWRGIEIVMQLQPDTPVLES